MISRAQFNFFRFSCCWIGLAFALCLNSNTWALDSVQSCELLISTSPEVSISIGQLPDDFHLDLNKNESRSYFELARTLFGNKVAAPDLKVRLKAISQNGITNESDADKATLKQMRKYSLILRSSFFLFDKSHLAPEEFDAFVTDFGHLNDSIALGDEEAAQSQSKDVLKDLKNLDFDSLEDEFKPANRDSFFDHMDEQVSVIKKALGKQKVKAKQFHEVRKILKDMMATYMFKTSVETSTAEISDNQAIYNFLFQLNEDMGLVHDQLIAQAHDGKIVYEDYELSIPLQIRKRVTAVLNRLPDFQ